MIDLSWEALAARLRSLRRDRENRLFLGVCAGIADGLGVGVVPVRIVAVLALWFLTLPTLVLYLALGVLLPERRLRFRGPREEREFWRRDTV